MYIILFEKLKLRISSSPTPLCVKPEINFTIYYKIFRTKFDDMPKTAFTPKH